MNRAGRISNIGDSLSVAGIMPLSALFVLFDFVIHNPSHGETEKNLALLDHVAAYLGVLDCLSGGALPGSIISEFAGIARQYVSKVHQRSSARRNGSALVASPTPDMCEGEEQLRHWPIDMDLDDLSVREIHLCEIRRDIANAEIGTLDGCGARLCSADV